jgi:hypothetical protein
VLKVRAVESLDASVAAFAANQQDQTLLHQHTPLPCVPEENPIAMLLDLYKTLTNFLASPYAGRYQLVVGRMSGQRSTCVTFFMVG